MDKVDRLLQLAKACESDGRVHIVTEGYCCQCKGTCRALENPTAVIILDDIPRKISKENRNEKRESFSGVIDDNSIVMYEGRPTRVGDIPGIHSLTRAERAMLLEVECGIVAQPEEPDEPKEVPKKMKARYKNLFGYG